MKKTTSSVIQIIKLEDALASSFKVYEDAVLFFGNPCVSGSNSYQDFQESELPAYAPEEFLKILRIL